MKTKQKAKDEIPGKESWRDLTITKICATCGKELYRTQFRLEHTNIRFCDKICKRNYEFNGNQKRRRKGSNRREHLGRKAELIAEVGIVCQFPGCGLELYGDRALVDMHHLGGPLNHEMVLLFCPYHHRLASNGYIKIDNGQIYLTK